MGSQGQAGVHEVVALVVDPEVSRLLAVIGATLSITRVEPEPTTAVPPQALAFRGSVGIGTYVLIPDVLGGPAGGRAAILLMMVLVG